LTDEPSGERLQKVLAQAGLGSRRACEALIEAGRVEVNGQMAVLGRRVDPEHDRVTLDGATIPIRPGFVYYVLNKPPRVVTTAHDPEGRPTVVDLVPAEPRVFPVGRLDWDTEGVLLLTNDGPLAHGLTHPSQGVPKTYLAEVSGVPGRAALRRLREGVDLEDGRTAPAKARLAQATPTGAALEIVIHEGRNRQVRRMCEAVGHPVRRLVRTRFGPLRAQRLAPGQWRPLTQAEIRALYAAVQNEISDA
jgi:23S rRNA pseudouridine2605 synthase